MRRGAHLDPNRRGQVAVLRGVLLLAALLLTGCRAVASVSLDEIRPGESVRAIYRVPDEIVVTNLIRQVNGSIEVRRGAESTPFRIQLLDLDALQVRRGHAWSRGSFIGALTGGGAGIVIGMVCQAQCPRNDKGSRYFAPVMGFIMGLPAGAAVGAIMAPARWVDVRLR